MNINMSDFFKNNITSGNTTNTPVNMTPDNRTENVSDKTALNQAGIKFLNSLMSGDTFTGFVNRVKGDTAFIMLNNGAEVSAKLSQGVSVGVGQNVTFMVEDNSSGKISIKPVLANEQQAVVIDKALEAAGLSPTSDNINIVKELLSLGMPIDADNLNQMVKNSIRFPEADINTLANLQRLDIPVTADNIKEFQLYGEFNGHIESSLSDMEAGIIDSFINGINDNIDNADNISNAMQNADKIISTLYEGLDNENIDSSLVKNALSDEAVNELNQLINSSVDDKFTADDIKNLSVRELINKLTELSSTDNKENIKDIFNSKSFKELIHAAINDTMKLTPKDVAEGEATVSSYYKRIRKNVENIENSIKSNGEMSESSLSKSLSDIKSNIDFMNDLNKNMTYFQMPIKFSESEGNGELYVFTNKKKIASNADNISAMLHLDMDNLKSMDIYVNLSKGNNVSTNFVLETEELLDFVYQHIDKLNERLEQLGYKTHFEMKVAADSNDRLDFVKDFVQKDIHPASGGQYIFDAKA